MVKKHLLWLTRYPPISTSAEAGSQTLNFYFKKFLEDERFDIHLISCAKPSDKDAIEKENYNVDYQIIYWSTTRIQKIKKLINIESKYNYFNRNANIISNTDVTDVLNAVKIYRDRGFLPQIIILEWTEIVILAPRIKKIFPDAKIVASEHDVTFIGYERLKNYYNSLNWFIKAKRIKKIELKALSICDKIMPQNPDNIDLLVEQGIEREKLFLLTPFFQNMSDCIRKSNRRDILFFGAMGREANNLSALWFIENVMPLLKDIQVRFVVLGGNPPAFLKKKEARDVHVTGYVKDIKPYFQSSMCFVAPLVIGAGIKVKVLEALSTGIPVLTNELGIEGIPAQDGKEYYYCKKPDDYERIIKKLFDGLINEREIEINAKNFIIENYSALKSCENYKEALINLIS